MSPLLEIRTLDDLNKALLLQRTTVRKVTQEIDDIVRNVVTPANQDDDEYLSQAIMEGEIALLRRYAALPTLIEYQKSPHLRGVMEPGATFAITAITGAVLLSMIRAICSAFPRAHTTLLLVMLTEIDKERSEDGDLVDTFIRNMKIELKGTPEEDRPKVLRTLVQPLTEAMITVAEHYQLIASHGEEGYSITPTGQRVMLHLFSAQKFIEAVSEAHTRLQGSIGPRSQSPQTSG